MHDSETTDEIRMKILDAKEQRWLHQKKLLASFNQTLISYKFNIPFWPKDTKEILSAFDISLKDFEVFLVDRKITYQLLAYQVTVLGPERYLTTPSEATVIKKIAIQFEEKHSIGRLIDIDILGVTGKTYDREIKRRCFICNDLAINCMRNEKHSQQEARNFFDAEINHYLKR